MHGKKFFAGGVFILLGVLSVDAWFSLPLRRGKDMHQRERTGGEIAWEELCWEGAALKMRSCWRGFYTEQLLQRSFTEELYTEDLLH